MKYCLLPLVVLSALGAPLQDFNPVITGPLDLRSDSFNTPAATLTIPFDGSSTKYVYLSQNCTATLITTAATPSTNYTRSITVYVVNQGSFTLDWSLDTGTFRWMTSQTNVVGSYAVFSFAVNNGTVFASQLPIAASTGGGGGDTIWSNGIPSVTFIEPTNSLQIVGSKGGVYVGDSGSISNNWGDPTFGDVFISTFNGEDGGNPTSANIYLANVLNHNFDAFGQLAVQARTNGVRLGLASGGNSGQVNFTVELEADSPSTSSYALLSGTTGTIRLSGDGSINATDLISSTAISVGLTGDVWKLGSPVTPAGVTNLEVIVNGQKFQVLAVPVP